MSTTIIHDRPLSEALTARLLDPDLYARLRADRPAGPAGRQWADLAGWLEANAAWSFDPTAARIYAWLRAES